MYILTFFVLYSSMLRSIKSNNSPGHFHNRLPSVVDLSTDFCPGIILKRNNKMKQNKTINIITAKYPNHDLFNKDGSVNYDHPYYHQFDNVDFSKQKIKKAKLIK